MCLLSKRVEVLRKEPKVKSGVASRLYLGQKTAEGDWAHVPLPMFASILISDKKFLKEVKKEYIIGTLECGLFFL